MKIIQSMAISIVAIGMVSVRAYPVGLKLEYSTYLGGSSYDGNDLAGIGGIAIDSNLCAYVTGVTGSSDFPISNPYQSSVAAALDIFISKLSSSGSSLIYSTYYGGGSYDWSFGIALDSDQCAYVSGDTGSNDFPIYSAYQSSYAGAGDAFLFKLSSSGSDIVFSTYFGGSYEDYSWDIALGPGNIIGIVGDTSSRDFPTYNAYQASYWAQGDAFVSCFASSGSSLEYSTYLGGEYTDYGLGVTIDTDACTYAVGGTGSDEFPIKSSYQATLNGGMNAYAVKLQSSGTELCYSTYIGGSWLDSGRDVVANSNGCIFVTGGAWSDNFPVCNAYQSTFGGGGYLYPGDAFISKLDSSGSRILYSTYLGGLDGDGGLGIALDSIGQAYIAGHTRSRNFPTVNPYQASYNEGTKDSFATCISSSGSFLIYSTYIGGSARDVGLNIALDSINSAYISGHTESMNFPTVNAYQSSYAGAIDAFVSKLKWEPTPTPTPISPIVTLECGDYDGDGTSEIAIFRPSVGSWRFRDLESTIFGREGDIPITGDYWGDGTSEIGVFRPATGSWLVRSLTRFAFGAGGDVPVPRDYDRDGKTDAAFFRAEEGLWSVRDLTEFYFGKAGDVPLPADYDGDEWMDTAIFRPSSGLWAVRNLTRLCFGTSGDIPVSADYDRDGTTEIAIYRPSTGLWAGVLSQEGPSRICLGIDGDIPVPANFDGGEWTQPAVFRPSSGLWAARNLTRCWFGMSGDLPVAK